MYGFIIFLCTLLWAFPTLILVLSYFAWTWTRCTGDPKAFLFDLFRWAWPHDPDTGIITKE